MTSKERLTEHHERHAACIRWAGRIESALRECNDLARNVSAQESAVADHEGRIRAAEIELSNLDASVIPSHPGRRNPTAELLGPAAEIAKERRKGQINDRIVQLRHELRRAQARLDLAREQYQNGEAELRNANVQ